MVVRTFEPQLNAHREAIGALCREHGLAALDVFGSATDGRFNPATSDYDFIARFLPRANSSVARRYLDFCDALEALLGRQVDVMTDHPIKNPYLRQAVNATRQSLYVAPSAEAPV